MKLEEPVQGRDYIMAQRLTCQSGGHRDFVRVFPDSSLCGRCTARLLYKQQDQQNQNYEQQEPDQPIPLVMVMMFWLGLHHDGAASGLADNNSGVLA